MTRLVEELERQLSVIARNLREPVVLADGRVVRRATVSLLYVLAELGPARMGVVSTALNLDPSTTTRQAQHAIELGLMDQVADLQDRRATRLTMTSAGRDLFDSLVTQQRRGLTHILGDWPARDQSDLVRLLTQFNAEISRLRAASVAPSGSD